MVTFVCRSNLASMIKTYVYDVRNFIRVKKKVESSSNLKEIHRQ